MKTKKSVVFLLLSILLVTGMLFTSCPGGGGEEDEIIKKPVIAKQVEIAQNPNSRIYTLTAWNAASPADKTLTVELSETTKASYQWYSKSKPYDAEGTTIAGATTASYVPDISTAGDYYYYVIVTATISNEETGEETTITLTSKTAYIKIIADDDPTATTEAPTEFKIGSDRLNYVRGVGGTGAFMFRSGNGDASPDADVEYIDLLMGELGANILRIMVQDEYEEYVTNSIQSRNQNQFYHNARDNFFPVIRRVNEYGGYVFANPWTAPKELKTPQSTIGTGSVLTPNGPNYVDYAEHLRNFLLWLNKNKAPIFAIGILNEPDYGGRAGYEGMGMTETVTMNWFKTVGNFTTQKVTNRSGVSIGSGSIFADDIIPGYGGGGPTHHVLAMSGDSMGDIAAYMDTQLNDPTANNYIELMGRHYYADTKRYVKVAGQPGTKWEDRPQRFGSTAANTSAYVGPKEAEALAMSPQMYAPGASPGNIKREIWQTEHDFNFGNSTAAPSNNAQNYWNSVFAPLHDIDWALRVCGESVYDWWYSSSFSGFVTGPTKASFEPHTITPRGRAFAHYARYVNETWFLSINQTKTKAGSNMTFNVTGTGNNGYAAGSLDPKISAFEDVNGKFISVVMYTPSNAGSIGSGFGGGGSVISNDPTDGSANVGRVSVLLPDGFTATSATAIRSYGHAPADGQTWDDVPTGVNRYWIDEPVFLSADGKSVEVTLPGGNIISIMVKGTWPGRPDIPSKPRVRPYTVQ